MIKIYILFQLTLRYVCAMISLGEDMKKSIRIVEIFIILFIIIIIGIVAGFIVSSVIKNMEFDKNKILVDNFANEILYAKELYMKNNNNVPKYCNINDDLIYYDENYNNKYDSNELLCNVDCSDENCIKYFITQNDISNKDVKCNRIIIEENNIEISNCFIENKELTNYKYTLKMDNSVE